MAMPDQLVQLLVSFQQHPLQLSGDITTVLKQVDYFLFVMFKARMQLWCHHLQVDCLIFSFMAMPQALEYNCKQQQQTIIGKNLLSSPSSFSSLALLKKATK